MNCKKNQAITTFIHGMQTINRHSHAIQKHGNNHLRDTVWPQAKTDTRQRVEIFHRYMTEDVSQRRLAREYGVSRRLITFIVNPEREKRNRELLNKRKAKGLYKPDRKKHTEIIREYRRYKQKLFKEGKIQLNTDRK